MQINRDSQTTFKVDEPLTASLLQNNDDLTNQQPREQNVSSNGPNQLIPSQQKPAPARLDSLDVYRGLTMVGMIIVDNQGPYPPWWLDHAAWDGLTPADLIFPSFLFIMGMAIPLASTKSKPLSPKNILRIAALFLIGVFLNLLARKFTFHHFRILGILQRMSIIYGAMLFIHVATRYGEMEKRVFGFIAVLCGFLIYIAYMMTFNHPEIDCPAQKNLQEYCNFSAWIDRAIFGPNHMIYPNDPEGLFSNLSALVTTYIGYTFCLIMKDHKGNMKKILTRWGIIAVILGLTVYPLTKMMPLNKKIYSASFALFTSASSGFTILFFVLLVDILPQKIQQVKKIIHIITRPFVWLGRNPLFVFVFMDLLGIIIERLVIINDKPMYHWIYKYCFQSWISNAEVASTAFACFFLLIWTAAAFLLYRKNIFIRL